MANPQLEDGHTQIANEILEALMRVYLPPNQWQVLLCIIRKTYGFRKKVDWIANFQIVEATDLVKSTVSRALKALHQQGLIQRNGKTIGFQKDWEQWEVSSTANRKANDDGEVSSTANQENPKKLADRKLKLADRKLKLAEQPTKVSSPRVTQKKKETIQKKLYKRNYGEFQNVLLTDEEHHKLEERFGDRVPALIEKLSAYVASKGAKYTSHYATILNWERRNTDGKAQSSRVLPKSYTPTAEYPDD